MWGKYSQHTAWGNCQSIHTHVWRELFLRDVWQYLHVIIILCDHGSSPPLTNFCHLHASTWFSCPVPLGRLEHPDLLFLWTGCIVFVSSYNTRDLCLSAKAHVSPATKKDTTLWTKTLHFTCFQPNNLKMIMMYSISQQLGDFYLWLGTLAIAITCIIYHNPHKTQLQQKCISSVTTRCTHTHIRKYAHASSAPRNNVQKCTHMHMCSHYI